MTAALNGKLLARGGHIARRTKRLLANLHAWPQSTTCIDNR